MYGVEQENLDEYEYGQYENIEISKNIDMHRSRHYDNIKIGLGKWVLDSAGRS